MRLSVIVVNWNSCADLRDCLASLEQQSHRDLEIIVVDNGSSDGSPEMVEAEFPRVRQLRQTENLGFAEACNRGIAASSGEWIALLNNDAVADPEWASALVEAANRVPTDCGMIQSLMLYRSRPNTINSTGIELAYSGGGRDRDEGQPYVPAEQQFEEIFCPTAGAAAYRRSMLEQIKLPRGYFDSVHFLYYEDMDLGWRARLAGWSAVYAPKSIVHHRWHGSSDRHGKSRLLVMSNINRMRMLVKNASPRFMALTVPRTLKESFEIVRHGGVNGVASLVNALRDSFAERRHVSALCRGSRTSIEKTWRAKPRRGQATSPKPA